MTINTFIATPGKGIVRCEQNQSGEWTVAALLTDYEVVSIAVTPQNPDVMFMGTQGSGVLRSNDRGKSWQPAGLDGEIVKSLAVSRTQPDTIYAGSKPVGLFVSHDGGQNWSACESFQKRRQWWWFTPAERPFTQPYVLGLAVSPQDPNTVIAGIEYGAVLRSTDGGKTWSKHCKGANRDCHMLHFHATHGDWAYQGSGGGAYISRDAGLTWTKPKGLLKRYGWAVGADPAQPDIWYCATSPGPGNAHDTARGDAQAYIYRSKAGGEWERLSGGLPQPLNYMPYAFVTDANAPGHVYAGLTNGDIWHSTDYGDSWAQLPLNVGSIHRALIGV